MWNDILALLKQELIVGLIILILLIIKVGATEWKTENILTLCQPASTINFLSGLLCEFRRHVV